MGASRTAAVFRAMHDAVEHDGPSLVSRVKSAIKFEIKRAGAWLVELKTGHGSVRPATPTDEADVTITLSEDTFLRLVDNQMNPQQAFVKGLMQIEGNKGHAMKLHVVLATTRRYMKQQESSGDQKETVEAPVVPTSTAEGTTTKNLDSRAIFQLLQEVVTTNGVAMAKQVKGVIQFDLPEAGKWHLDLKSSVPALTEELKNADVVITVSDADFVAIAMGKLNAQQAFVNGKLKLKGNMMLATKLPIVFNALGSLSKL